MKFLMPLTIIVPRKRLPTLLTLKRPLPSMTPQMTPLMKAPRKPLPAQLARPRRRRRRLYLPSKSSILVRCLGMEKLLVLL